jgi:ATP-dependent 26S proteasome regulatory subunit
MGQAGAGRFSKEIEVVSPDENGRWEILKIKCRNMALAGNCHVADM